MISYDTNELHWIRAPKKFSLSDDRISMVTEPNTDLWQRTFYGFSNDTAPVLYLETEAPSFTFSVKAWFDSDFLYDQCGLMVYQDSDNWLKASLECENEEIQRLGSVLTNDGYSDWASVDVPAEITTMYYRLSREKSDFRIEYSYDGQDYQQMRLCHMTHAEGPVRVGVYACSPRDSSFEAVFTEMKLTESVWQKES